MEVKNYFATDTQGNVLGSAQVYLYLAGTNTLATGLQNISGAALGNPFTSDNNGLVQFKAPDNNYDLRVVKPGREFTIRIQCFDGVAFMSDLRSASGASKVYHGAVSVAQKLDDLSGDILLAGRNSFKKSVRLEVALIFPDYNAAFVAVGSPSIGYLYPQGHCYDSDSNVYIKYGNGNANVIVWWKKDGSYGGWFLISPGGESLAIIDSNGARRLYSRGGASSTMLYYDITSMPVNGSSPQATDLGLTGIGLQYAHDGGDRWIVEQSDIDYGGTGSRTKWRIYDNNFVQKGDFYVSKNVVGWQTSGQSLYPYVPKSQGVCIREDKIIFGTGGTYIPAGDGPISPVVAGVGVAQLNFDGSIYSYGIVRADKLIERLVNKGYNCVRTESEGVSLRPDKTVSHMVITVRPGTPGANSSGILFFEELDADGDDYSDIAEQYTPFNMSRTFIGPFPRSGSSMKNPFTLNDFSSIAQIIDYMAVAQVPLFSWYTSAVSVSPLSDLPLPANAYVEIKNINNSSFIVRVSPIQSSGKSVCYCVAHSAGTSTYSTVRLGIETDSIDVTRQSGGATINLSGAASSHRAVIGQTLGINRFRISLGDSSAESGSDSGSNLAVASYTDSGAFKSAPLVIVRSTGETQLTQLLVSGPLKPGQYLLAALPSAAAYNGYEIDVTNATGGSKRCRSNGSVWQILNTTTTVS